VIKIHRITKAEEMGIAHLEPDIQKKILKAERIIKHRNRYTPQQYKNAQKIMTLAWFLVD
jgi:hypothetical protein